MHSAQCISISISNISENKIPEKSINKNNKNDTQINCSENPLKSSKREKKTYHYSMRLLLYPQNRSRYPYWNYCFLFPIATRCTFFSLLFVCRATNTFRYKFFGEQHALRPTLYFMGRFFVCRCRVPALFFFFLSLLHLNIRSIWPTEILYTQMNLKHTARKRFNFNFDLLVHEQIEMDEYECDECLAYFFEGEINFSAHNRKDIDLSIHSVLLCFYQQWRPNLKR